QPRLPRGAFRFLTLPNTATVPTVQATVLRQVAGDLGTRPPLKELTGHVVKDSLHISDSPVSDPVTRGIRSRQETERRGARGTPRGSLECPVRVDDPCLYGSRL